MLCQYQGGPTKQAQSQLSGLFNSIASFFHPSNHGRWLVSVVFFVKKKLQFKKILRKNQENPCRFWNNAQHLYNFTHSLFTFALIWTPLHGNLCLFKARIIVNSDSHGLEFGNPTEFGHSSINVILLRQCAMLTSVRESTLIGFFVLMFTACQG